MNITGAATAAITSFSNQKVGDAVGIAVANKAMNSDVATAVQLINSTKQTTESVSSQDKTTTLGRNIDVQA